MTFTPGSPLNNDEDNLSEEGLKEIIEERDKRLKQLYDETVYRDSEFKKIQEDLISETVKKIDIIICTALIPGKKAPIIIKDKMIDNMQPGSIIYDLAAIQGGNTSSTKKDTIVNINGVKIMGDSNILNKLPTSASNLYAKNIFNFVSNLLNKEKDNININLEDEIIEKTLIK